MGTDDRFEATGDDVKGHAKEAAGKVTGDRSLENEGKGDQAKASAKHAAEDVKDAAKNAADSVKDAFKR